MARMTVWCVFLVIVLLSVALAAAAANGIHNNGSRREETAETWNKIGEDEIVRAESYEPIKHRAKNVILFLGDGMGISTVTSARIYKGGEESLLFFETFPNTALSKTYCADTMVTDSAASATAYQCGVKVNKGTLGLDPRVQRYDCQGSLDTEMQLTSILDWTLAEGKSAGIVTTTRVTHATPGGAYANSADRDWEGDSQLTDEAKQLGCRDIARQLIEDYPNLQVVMGGGRQHFLPGNTVDPETGVADTKYGRRDNRDLTKEWLGHHKGLNRTAHYVYNRRQLLDLDLDNTDHLLGLFASSHMNYNSDRDPENEPSLAEMTVAAIRILSKNPKGFYLLVEGGRIDHSHHSNVAYQALNDTAAFADAVEAASEVTLDNETLTIATADHSHTLVLAGYQSRGSNIFNVADTWLDSDNHTYTSLLYGTGPGYRYNQTTRHNLTNQETNGHNYTQEASVPMPASTHAGEDVGIWAKGPMAHMFHATHEENYIAHVMAYATCVGRYKEKGWCPPLKGHTKSTHLNGNTDSIEEIQVHRGKKSSLTTESSSTGPTGTGTTVRIGEWLFVTCTFLCTLFGASNDILSVFDSVSV